MEEIAVTVNAVALESLRTLSIFNAIYSGAARLIFF
jgi:hypothetical protein